MACLHDHDNYYNHQQTLIKAEQTENRGKQPTIYKEKEDNRFIGLTPRSLGRYVSSFKKNLLPPS
jgi:hypothetical protein